MSLTQIKRLFLNSTEFVPITLAEAVVVNTSTIPGLTSMGITTLDKVLRSTLGLVGNNALDIGTVASNLQILTGAVASINSELEKKQNKLKPGVGISITEQDGDTVISVNNTIELYRIVTKKQFTEYQTAPGKDYENIIFLVPSTTTAGNIFREYLCIFKDNTYQWEEFGTILTEVDLSGYATKTDLSTLETKVGNALLNCITAENVKTSTDKVVVVSYSIPADLYDSAVLENLEDNITPDGGDPEQVPEATE